MKKEIAGSTDIIVAQRVGTVMKPIDYRNERGQYCRYGKTQRAIIDLRSVQGNCILTAFRGGDNMSADRSAGRKSYVTRGGRPSGIGGPGGPRGAFGKPVERAKDFRGSLKRLIKYLQPHKIRLGIVLVFAIAGTLFSITAPKVMAKAVNKLQDGYMAKTTISTLSEMQQKALEMITKQMQCANSPNTNTGQITESGCHEGIRNSGLPLLSTITDAEEKADICQRIIDISKMIPFEGKAQKCLGLRAN